MIVFTDILFFEQMMIEVKELSSVNWSWQFQSQQNHLQSINYDGGCRKILSLSISDSFHRNIRFWTIDDKCYWLIFFRNNDRVKVNWIISSEWIMMEVAERFCFDQLMIVFTEILYFEQMMIEVKELSSVKWLWQIHGPHKYLQSKNHNVCCRNILIWSINDSFLI